MIIRTIREKLTFKSFIRKRKISLFSVNEEVRQALHDRKPVIALESTMITHGMKFPHNYNTAREAENVIREQNAVPAVIGVIKGQIKVGLSSEEIEELSQKQECCLKVSRRDFPYVISQKLTGGTTVSGTIVIAHRMGIPIFVTGGIGGVHRDGEVTMDVSADLTELGKTSIAVISSGVKSILDIPKTLEYLETEGVAVATFGSTADFPAFYCRKSGQKSPYNLSSYKDAAKFIQSSMILNSGSGVLIAVPVPEEYSLDENIIEQAIEMGLKEAREKNLKGKNVTPFVLNRVSEITGGMSLRTNIALIRNNALVGAKIAVELSKLREIQDKVSKKEQNESFCDFVCGRENQRESSPFVQGRKNDNFDVVVVGGSNLDFVVKIENSNFRPLNSQMISPNFFGGAPFGDRFESLLERKEKGVRERAETRMTSLGEHSRENGREKSSCKPEAVKHRGSQTNAFGTTKNGVRPLALCLGKRRNVGTSERRRKGADGRKTHGNVRKRVKDSSPRPLHSSSQFSRK